MTCPITADRDAWRGGVTEREAALVDALRRIAGECGPHSQPFPEASPDYPAFAVMEAREALTDFARAHTATDAGGEA